MATDLWGQWWETVEQLSWGLVKRDGDRPVGSVVGNGRATELGSCEEGW
jgi:hypothetical protein